MTTARDKIRGLFLALLMVTSVFAGTIALAGTAAAANNANAVGLTPDTVSDNTTVRHDLQFTYDSQGSGNETVNVTLPVGQFNTSQAVTTTINGGAQDVTLVGVSSDGQTATFEVASGSGPVDLNVSAAVDHADVSTDTTAPITISIDEANVGSDPVSTSVDVTLLDIDDASQAEADDTLASAETRWYGQTLYFQDPNANLGDTYELVQERDEQDNTTEVLGTFRVDGDGEAVISTEVYIDQADLGSDVVVRKDGNYYDVGSDGVVDTTITSNKFPDSLETSVIKQGIDLSFRDSSNNNRLTTFGQNDDNVDARIDSNRGDGYNATITVDDTANVTDADLLAAFGNFNARDANADVAGSGIVVTVNNQRVQKAIDASALPAQDIDFTIDVEDAVASDTESVTVQESVTANVVPVGASFNATTVGDGEQQVGDIVEITVNYDADYSDFDDGTKFQTVVTLGGTNAGFVDAILVTDQDRDGKATFTVNTYTLGTAPVNTSANPLGTGTYALQDTGDVYNVAGDSVADAPSDGDPADSLFAFRVDEAYLDTDAFDLKQQLDRPVEADSYTLRTHDLSELDSGQQPITTTSQQEGDAVVTRLAYPVEDDAAELVLDERGVGNFTTWIAPSGADISTLSDVTGAVEAGALTTDDTVAEGDKLVVEVEAEGLGGQIEAVEDETGDARKAFLGYDGVFMVVEQQNPDANTDRFYVDIDGPGVTLIQNQDTDTYYFVIDTSRIQDARTGNGITTDAQFDRGEYEVQFVKAGGPFADFFEEGDFPDADTVDFNSIFPHFGDGVATDFDPYQTQNEQQLQSATASVVQRQATFDRVDPDGNLRVVGYETGSTVSGQTTLAPGSEFVVRLQNESSDRGFLVRQTVEVQPDQTWSFTTDLSDAETPTTFRATAQESGVVIVSDAQAGIEGFVPGVLTGASTVTFEDQETAGGGVTVSSVYLPQGGFVTIHDSSLLDGATFDSVVGTSQYLPPGTHEDVRVSVDIPQDESELTLIAMPHQDTDEDQLYDFVSSNGSDDAPYTEIDGETIVVADATVTNVNADTPTPEPTDSPTPEPTDSPTPEPTDSPEPTDTETMEPTDSPTETGSPGFGLVVSILALIGAALLALRRD